MSTTEGSHLPVGVWSVDLLEVEGELAELHPGFRITLEIDGAGHVSGKALNRFFGSTTPGSSTLFGPLGATRMAGPEEIMRQESVLFQLLGRVDGYEAETTSLLVGGRVVMVLGRVGTEEE